MGFSQSCFFDFRKSSRLSDSIEDLRKRGTKKDVEALERTKTYLIAKSMAPVADVRERFRHGTFKARVHRELPDAIALYHEAPAMDFTLGVLFLGLHAMYRRRLEATRIRGVVHMPAFLKFFNSLTQEWTGELSSVYIPALIR